MAVYEYLMLGHCGFQVIKRWEEKGKFKYEEYLVSFNPIKKEWHCDCKGWNYSKMPKTCKHIKFIISQLTEKGLGILKAESDFQWEAYFKNNSPIGVTTVGVLSHPP